MASDVAFMSRLKLPVVIRERLFVYGYLRIHFQFEDDTLQIQSFPKIIMNICLIYYAYIIDEWDPKYIGKCHRLQGSSNVLFYSHSCIALREFETLNDCYWSL